MKRICIIAKQIRWLQATPALRLYVQGTRDHLPFLETDFNFYIDYSAQKTHPISRGLMYDSTRPSFKTRSRYRSRRLHDLPRQVLESGPDSCSLTASTSFKWHYGSKRWEMQAQLDQYIDHSQPGAQSQKPTHARLTTSYQDACNPQSRFTRMALKY